MTGYRKFAVAMAFWLSTSLLCAFGRVDGGQYVMAIGLIIGLYGAGNVGEHFSPSARPQQ